MDTSIIVALITCFGVCLGAILTFVVQIKKLRNETEQNAIKQTEEFKNTIRNSLEANRNEYLDGIADVKHSIGEINVCVASMQQSMNSQWALFDVKMQGLGREMTDLKHEVSIHNGFAQEIPLLKEKLSVSNHRLTTVEDRLNGKETK